MTEQIAQAVRRCIEKKEMTLSDYAKEMGMQRQYLNDLLALRKGNMPSSWQEILDDLGLELVVRVKK